MNRCDVLLDQTFDLLARSLVAFVMSFGSHSAKPSSTHPPERLQRIAELEAALAASEAQNAAKDARIAEPEQRVAELSARLTELAEKLGQNSRNSHRPPSSDSPAARGQRRGKGKSKSKRKRGAQPGHRPAQRSLLPPEEVD